MYQHTRLTTNRLGFFQKFRNFDYILLVCILLLGFISLATMYSTDGGEVKFHTKSHFTKLAVFTLMMLVMSFINIKYWFSVGYLAYIAVIGLLVGTYLFGITSSGSQRWINLYFINLQPSELMKILVPLMIASFYSDKSLPPKFKNLVIAAFIIIVPGLLIAKQPDLGTAILITTSGVIAIFLSGIRLVHIFLGLAFVIGAIPFLWSLM